VSSLNPDTFYAYKFCVTTLSNDEVCGDEVIFYTDEDFELPEIVIYPPSNVMERSALFSAGINDMGSFGSLNYYFTYKKSTEELYLTFTTQRTAQGEMTINTDVSNLVGDTTYDVKFCVDVGVVYCTDARQFTTTAVTSDIFIPPTSIDPDNEFDAIWQTLFQGSQFAMTLMGFFLVLAILFIGISAFGKVGMQMGSFAVMIFLFIGVFIATLLRLFPMIYMILFLVGGILLIVLKQMFFTGASGGD